MHCVRYCMAKIPIRFNSSCLSDSFATWHVHNMSICFTYVNVAIMFHRSIGNNCDSLWPNDVVNPSLQVVVMTWSMLSNLTWAATPRRRRRHPDHTHRSREGRSKCRTSFERKLPSRHDLGSCANHDSWVTMGNLGESKN